MHRLPVCGRLTVSPFRSLRSYTKQQIEVCVVQLVAVVSLSLSLTLCYVFLRIGISFVQKRKIKMSSTDADSSDNSLFPHFILFAFHLKVHCLSREIIWLDSEKTTSCFVSFYCCKLQFSASSANDSIAAAVAASTR